MFFDPSRPILSVAWIITELAFLFALFPILFRILRGPTLFDRIIALDLFGGICLGVMVSLSIRFDQPVFLEVAFVIALVGFLGTVALARYLERGGEG